MAALLVAVVSVVALVATRHEPEKKSIASCAAQVGAERYTLDLAQAANAATIAAVGRQSGMPNHAVTIAIAAAFQESLLYNLAYGDRDSVGLFQQRPSAGWGSRAQLLSPRYAASAFYRALSKVPGWGALSVTDAAQRVQRSAAPDAYARWEAEARLLARVLTGEEPSGFGCRFAVPSAVSADSRLAVAMTRELGTSTLASEPTPGHGWAVASWLVAHAHAYRITEVTFAGLVWTPSSGGWQTRPPARPQVQLRRAGVRPGAEISS